MIVFIIGTFVAVMLGLDPVGAVAAGAALAVMAESA